MWKATVTPGLVHPGPDRVEVRVAGRAPVGGPGGQQDDPGPLVEHEVELGDREVAVGQGEQRGGEDLPVPAEAPLLVEPAVERVEVGVDGGHVFHVVLHRQRHRRGEHHRPLHALRLHELEPGLPVEVLRPHRLGLVGLVRVARRHLAEHLLQGARPVGEVEAEALLGVEDRDPVGGENALGAVMQPHRRDGVLLPLFRQVPGERVACLVAVGVTVEQPVFQPGHLESSGDSIDRAESYNVFYSLAITGGRLVTRCSSSRRWRRAPSPPLTRSFVTFGRWNEQNGEGS